MEQTKSCCRDIGGIDVRTEFHESVFTFNWKIDNISKQLGKIIRSPSFKLNSNHEFYAEFKIDSSNSSYLWFYLNSGPGIIMEHNVSIINNGKVLLNHSKTFNYTTKKSEDLLPSCVGDAMKEVLKENSITFKIVLKFEEICHYSINQNRVSPLDEMSNLSRDLKSLYEAPLYPDITLRIGDCTVKANKCILAARSSVFARMFEAPMKEAEKNVVNITDLDSTTVQNLVSYLYTAVLPCDDFDSVYSLYYAGDKYDVPNLRAACQSFILSKMDVENVCRVLSLAELHSDAELKKQALKFVDFHFEEVLQTESWKELVKSSSELAVEVAVLCSGRSKKIEKVLE